MLWICHNRKKRVCFEVSNNLEGLFYIEILCVSVTNKVPIFIYICSYSGCPLVSVKMTACGTTNIAQQLVSRRASVYLITYAYGPWMSSIEEFWRHHASTVISTDLMSASLYSIRCINMDIDESRPIDKLSGRSFVVGLSPAIQKCVRVDGDIEMHELSQGLQATKVHFDLYILD